MRYYSYFLPLVLFYTKSKTFCGKFFSPGRTDDIGNVRNRIIVCSVQECQKSPLQRIPFRLISLRVSRRFLAVCPGGGRDFSRKEFLFMRKLHSKFSFGVYQKNTGGRNLKIVSSSSSSTAAVPPRPYVPIHPSKL